MHTDPDPNANTPDDVDQNGRHVSLPVSAPDSTVDRERQPGVPPPSADEDYEDPLDQVGAESFPASDPPSSY